VSAKARHYSFPEPDESSPHLPNLIWEEQLTELQLNLSCRYWKN